MEIKVPEWILNTKEIRANNCRSVYRDTLDKKLGIGSFLDWETIRTEVEELKITTKDEYMKKRRYNWPTAPHLVYKKQWKNWPHFLGKKITEFLSFKECRQEVIKNKITSGSNYLDRKKNNWPYEPQSTYKKEWKGWPHFLGRKEVDFLPYEEFIQQLNKNKIFDPKSYKVKRRPEWPCEPHVIYKGKWKGWLCLRLLSFKECREEVLKNKIKSIEEYKRKRKWNWPARPCSFYKKEKEWKGRVHFLGIIKKERFLSFDKCKEEIKKYKFSSERKYLINKKPNWPSAPKLFYKKQWKGWGDFLGREDVSYLSFEKCRKEVRQYGFKSRTEYVDYAKKHKTNWPLQPDAFYKKRNKWKGWLYFLGKSKLFVSNFVSFEQCISEIKKLNITSMVDYLKNRKSSWPSNPNIVYKKQWKNWPHFLGRTK